MVELDKIRSSFLIISSSYSHFFFISRTQFSDLRFSHSIYPDCWTVVKLKRYIEQRQTPNTPGGPLATPPQVELSDAASASDAASNATIATNITYPDVGDFLYGKQFQSYIAVCVCVQQLAICKWTIIVTHEE
jgi:hypothetical protein